MLLMPSEDLVQSSWKVQSSNRSFILDTSRKTWKLTWPKNRKGKRNVSPLHIQDWNPSAETEKQSLVMFCFFWSTLTPISLLNSLTFEMFEEADLCHRCSSVLGHLWPCTLILTTAPISHPSPISPTQTWCCRWLKQLKWLSSKIAYPLWGPADFSLPKLAACISSRSGSSTEGTEQSLEEQKD